MTLLDGDKANGFIDVTPIDLNKVSGNLIPVSFKHGDQQVFIINPQKPPLFACGGCGKMFNSFDTITKHHNAYYPRKEGKLRESKSEPYYGTCLDFKYEEGGTVWSLQKNILEYKLKFETDHPTSSDKLKLDITSIPQKFRKLS
jgi:hypothetical protein